MFEEDDFEELERSINQLMTDKMVIVYALVDNPECIYGYKIKVGEEERVCKNFDDMLKNIGEILKSRDAYPVLANNLVIDLSNPYYFFSIFMSFMIIKNIEENDGMSTVTVSLTNMEEEDISVTFDIDLQRLQGADETPPFL